MKIKAESRDFIDFTNLHPGKTWNLDVVPWPGQHQICWRVEDRQLVMDHVEARKVSRVLRAHFLKRFRAVPAEKKQPAIEAECIRFCDSMDTMAKEVLHHNRQIGGRA